MTIINIADRRHPGLDLEFFDQVAAELGFGREITADLRHHLLSLDARMRRGCEESERCWRLLRLALVDAIPYTDREAAIDALHHISALVKYWSAWAALEEQERANAG
jgi:hypothetical protein